jgi:hypothetical protein
MQARITGALDRIVARHPGGCVVAVSHADPIKAAVAQLSPAVTARVDVFDAYCSIEHMMLKPQYYGFTQATALCIESNAGPGSCATDASVAASYIQWDASHKTTRVHEIMAQRMALQIKYGAHVEPGPGDRSVAPMPLSR